MKMDKTAGRTVQSPSPGYAGRDIKNSQYMNMSSNVKISHYKKK